VGASYTKTESDNKYQPKGNYLATGYSYSKTESDNKYQPKGNYLATGYSYSKSESDGKYQPKGSYSNKNTVSKALNGWWKCGDTGLIYFWGETPPIEYTTITIDMPISVPNKLLSAQVACSWKNVRGEGNLVSYVKIEGKKLIITADHTKSSAKVSRYWFAIGY